MGGLVPVQKGKGDGVKRIVLILLIVLSASIPAEAHEYSDIFDNATESDYMALESVVYKEAARCIGDSETYEQLFPCCVAVVETVCNRVLNPEWGSTIKSVCEQSGQFCHGTYKTENSIQAEAISDAITYVVENGRTQLPSTNFCYFATKKQSLGKNHVWIGGRHADGRVWKMRGMYFCEGRQ